nr:NIM-2 protein [Haemonchus contortus]
MKAQADDNNEENCVDKQLRADIAEAVKDAEDSCQDENFCRYDTVKGGKVYTLTLAKLDKSEPQPAPEE